MVKPYRTKEFNINFNREPNTGRFCEICRRDLKEGQRHRLICFELDRFEAVHQDDWQTAQKEITKSRKALSPVCIAPIGLDCARKFGLEWSKDPDDV